MRSHVPFKFYRLDVIVFVVAPTSRFGDRCTVNRTAIASQPDYDECPTKLNEFCDPDVQQCLCQQYFEYDNDLAQCRYDWFNAFIVGELLSVVLLALCVIVLYALLARWLNRVMCRRRQRLALVEDSIVEESSVDTSVADSQRQQYAYYMRERERELKVNAALNGAFSD